MTKIGDLWCYPHEVAKLEYGGNTALIYTAPGLADYHVSIGDNHDVDEGENMEEAIRRAYVWLREE
jgi:hypothetical protein